MAEVKFGVFLWPMPLEQAQRVEELGFDSLWVSEHMLFFVPTFDAITVLAAFAARTQRILLGSAVLLLPLRHPTVVAKEVASLDIISNGRIILGVGVGGEFPREFVACGVPVIGSDSGHIPRLIEETGGGLVFAEGDTEALAEALRHLLSDTEDAARKAEQGREVILQQYAVPRVAEKLHAALRTMLG